VATIGLPGVAVECNKSRVSLHSPQIGRDRGSVNGGPDQWSRLAVGRCSPGKDLFILSGAISPRGQCELSGCNILFRVHDADKGESLRALR
jgi:hypothetical protein